MSIIKDRTNDPGAMKFGNFINYYQFNPAKERLQLLPKDFQWVSDSSNDEAPYLILDVGCNSGELTQLLHNFLKETIASKQIIILGVDIDPDLINRANEHNENENVQFQCIDVMENNLPKIDKFLKIHNKLKFDAIFCLSVTMWIHLNHFDEGLKMFLEKMSNISRLFIVEPQPWKCYQTAVRRMKKANKEAFPAYKDLKWRNNIELEIEIYLETVLHRKKIYETAPTKWKRKLCFFQ